MIKESKYLIRKILVGVGICLVLGFINSCDVKASNDIDMGTFQLPYSPYTPTINYVFDKDNLKLKLSRNYNNVITNQSLDISSDYKYLIAIKGTISHYSYFGELYFSDSKLYLNRSDNRLYCKNLPCHFLKYVGDSNNAPTVGHFDTITITSNTENNPRIGGLSNNQNIGTVTNYYVNFDFYNNYNTLVQSSNSSIIIQPLLSTLESFGVVKNKDEEENVIVSYTFHPLFNNFDLTRFNYQYKIGDNNWLSITSNNVSFNVNQNTTVYFRIIRKSDNEIVDSQSYTITNILKYLDTVNENWNVRYTSENRNINDDESLPNKLVDNVAITFSYYPKQSNLKYQYQYVEENNSLGTWIDMPNNDYERTYSVSVNGIMYNRILDSNDNVLYTSTFKVNSIGTAMINSNLNWYNKLFGKVNYGKGISSIFFLPVRLLEVYKIGLESGFCNQYSFGELWGHELIMPCINVRGLVGNNIYNFIDIIGVGFISLAIINFIVNIYNGIVFMNLQDRLNEDKGSRLL